MNTNHPSNSDETSLLPPKNESDAAPGSDAYHASLVADMRALSQRINQAWHAAHPDKPLRDTPYFTRDLNALSEDLKESAHNFVVRSNRT
jgi:hypothetical protein